MNITCYITTDNWNHLSKEKSKSKLINILLTQHYVGKRNDPTKPTVPSKPTTVEVTNTEEPLFKPVKYDPMLIALNRDK